jgi:hypothetical protein
MRLIKSGAKNRRKSIREDTPLISSCSHIAHTISIRGHQAEKAALYLPRIS